MSTMSFWRQGSRHESRRRRNLIIAATTAAALVSLVGCSSNGAGADTNTGTTTKAATVQSVKYINNSAQPQVGLIGQDKGFFKANNVKVTFSEIPTGQQAIAGMIGGAGDFVTSADARFIQAVDSGLPVVAIGMHNTGFLGALIVPAKDKTTKSFADLVGKRIGLQVGTGIYTAWRRYLTKVNLKESDFTVVNIKTSAMAPAIAGGSIDAAITWQPFTSTAILNGVAREAMTPAEIAKPLDLVYPFYLLTTEKMIKDRPEAVQNFMDAWVCTKKWIAKNPEKTASLILPTFKGLTLDTINAEMSEQFYDAHTTVDDATYNDTVEQAKELVALGQMKEVPDLKSHIDNSFGEKALAKGCSAQ